MTEGQLQAMVGAGNAPTIYVALRSVPDYHAPAPSFQSAHASLEGAIAALYPNEDQERFREMFRPSPYSKDTWDGPDGFGMVRKLEVLP